MEITYAIELHMKHWRNAFSEEDRTILRSNYIRWVILRYGTSGIIGGRKFVRLMIDLGITNYIPELHLGNCTKALLEATDISTRAVPISSFQKLKTHNQIESLVKYWKIALCEAVEISRLVVQHYRGITDNEVKDIEKHARDALREAASLPGTVILNSR
ncbi:hypothetical protein V8G54_009132 [Vigna mungo]|uniref:Uncharacterized protein n=1 Tax=Vigna mungo TaxID=3915 RepID=A0AAQ3NVJ1_VIGMU